MNVLLVDGTALAYRSYFAFVRNPLVSSRGEPTSLVFGFATTLLRWLRSQAPGRAAVVFDPPGPTQRHALYPAYKANRPPRPAELTAQWPRLLEMLAALRLPAPEIPGWEADDVLATLARHCEARGDLVYVASGDKDFRQLLSSRVKLLRPLPGLGADAEVGSEDLRREFGLDAAQIVDVMALAGDPVDNVPGVRGVGEKTAAALIRTHGSLDELLARVDAVPQPGLRAKLAAGAKQALLARELVRLRVDVPVDCDALVPPWPGPDWQVLQALLRELELFQVLRQLPAGTSGEPGWRGEAVRDATAADRLARALSAAGRFSVHCEATAAPGAAEELAALGFAWAGREARAVRVAVEPPPAPAGQLDLRPPPGPGVDVATLRRILGPVLADASLPKCGHDLKRVARLLERCGLSLAGSLRDTMLAAYVLNPERRRHDLEATTLEIANARPGEGELGLTTDAAGTELDRVEFAAAAGAAAAWQLDTLLQPRLAAEGLVRLYDEVEMPLLRVLHAMERAGVQIDSAALVALSRELLGRAEALADRIFALAGRRFNLQSTAQLGEMLFAELRLPHGRRTKSGWSTDADVLESLAAEHEIVRLLLEYRQVTKLRSTYAEALPRLVDPQSGRIHTSFQQAVATTGRLSSVEPNLQNIPARTELGRRIRAAFVPREPQGWLVSADYSQIELRIMAHLSEDPGLVAAFRSGVDVHRATAARIAGCDPAAVTPAQRAAAKTVNFGVLYGMGPRGLAARLGISGEDARRFIDEYFASYPGVRRCIDALVAQARATGSTTTLLGRKLRLSDIDSPHPARRAAAERLAVNAPIQGSAADLVKLAMVRVHDALAAADLRAQLVLQVHDELLFDVPAGEVAAVQELARREMESALDLRVPIVVDLGAGHDWAEAH
jgi:DNA polymerase-1